MVFTERFYTTKRMVIEHTNIAVDSVFLIIKCTATGGRTMVSGINVDIMYFYLRNKEALPAALG